MKREDLQFFNRRDDLQILGSRNLPHWMQSGTLCFITWRVSDSLPISVLTQLDDELERFLLLERARGNRPESVPPMAPSWEEHRRLQWERFVIRDQFLDRGLGRCPLREPDNAAVVLASLLKFDEQEYYLTDVVVMPNHVHLIAAFVDEVAMLPQCTAWKRFTARSIHRIEGRKGDFWQTDQFDHLIRDENAFQKFRQYIADNPVKAGLVANEYLHWRKELGA